MYINLGLVLECKEKMVYGVPVPSLKDFTPGTVPKGLLVLQISFDESIGADSSGCSQKLHAARQTSIANIAEGKLRWKPRIELSGGRVWHLLSMDYHNEHDLLQFDTLCVTNDKRSILQIYQNLSNFGEKHESWLV